MRFCPRIRLKTKKKKKSPPQFGVNASPLQFRHLSSGCNAPLHLGTPVLQILLTFISNPDVDKLRAVITAVPALT